METARISSSKHPQPILFIRVLENHVFLDPEIERSILARDVFLSAMQNCEPLAVVYHQKVSS
jgi:hypothetical protein